MVLLGERGRRYGLTLLVFAIGLGLSQLEFIKEGPSYTTIVIFVTILVPAWRGGLGPALLASVLVSLYTLYLDFTPRNLTRAILLMGMSAVVGAMAESLLRARRRAEESRRALSAVLDSIGEGVIATDQTGRVTFANPVACHLTGFDLLEIEGRPITEVVRLTETDGQPIPCPISHVLRNGQAVGPSGSPHLVDRNEHARPVQAGARPIRDRGTLRGAVLVIRDDTVRRAAEQHLREDARRKDDFIAMLAHELRNPLGAIRLAVEMLGETDEPADHDWVRQVLERQVGQLGRILDDLLDVARITRGRVALRTEVLDTDHAVARAVDSIRARSQERGHALVVRPGPGDKPTLADPVRLEQVLVNLLVNACKYTPPGGLIQVETAREGDAVVIRVQDNGSGIREDLLPSIFDPFAQGDRPIDRGEGGLGIGLSVVRGLVERHGGTVTAESPGLGQGSTFTVRLPAAEDPASPAPPTDHTAPQPAGAVPRRGKVLIVDDNADLATSLARLLARAGYRTATAHDGPEGLHAADAFGPDAVLLDIGLPGLSGFDVARHLRADERFRQTLLIAISGYGTERDRRDSREAGFDHHLLKPIDFPAVLDLVSQGLGGDALPT